MRVNVHTSVHARPIANVPAFAEHNLHLDGHHDVLLGDSGDLSTGAQTFAHRVLRTRDRHDHDPVLANEHIDFRPLLKQQLVDRILAWPPSVRPMIPAEENSSCGFWG